DVEPDSAVFFHDYHLYLAPRMVRERRPETPLVHFVHIPWPQSDYWRVLPPPIRRAIHGGLLACDLIGFHTPPLQRDLLRSPADMGDAACDFEAGTIDYDGHRTRVAARPLSVDAAEFDELAASETVRALEREFEASRPGLLWLRA